MSASLKTHSNHCKESRTVDRLLWCFPKLQAVTHTTRGRLTSLSFFNTKQQSGRSFSYRPPSVWTKSFGVVREMDAARETKLDFSLLATQPKISKFGPSDGPLLAQLLVFLGCERVLVTPLNSSLLLPSGQTSSVQHLMSVASYFETDVTDFNKICCGYSWSPEDKLMLLETPLISLPSGHKSTSKREQSLADFGGR